jgi:hypothetical protein
VPQPYFIAFDGGGDILNFNTAGRVSPDGKWYAVPAGRIIYGPSLPDNPYFPISEIHFVISEIRVFSTGINSKLLYRVPWDSRYRYTPDRIVFPLEWKNNSTIAYFEYYPSSDNDYEYNYLTYHFNPFNGAKTLISDATRQYWNISPDGTLGINDEDEHQALKAIADGSSVTNLPDGFYLFWLPDSSYLLIDWNKKTEDSSIASSLTYYDREGQSVDSPGQFEGSGWLPLFNRAFYSPSNHILALHFQGDNTLLYLFDFQQHHIVALCFNNPVYPDPTVYRIYWSPSGNQLLVPAQNKDRTVEFHIIDWQTGDNYVIGEYAIPYPNDIIGWYPNEKTPSRDGAK